MEIYFNPQKAIYQVFGGNHEDGSEPEYESADIMKCVTYLTVQKEAANG